MSAWAAVKDWWGRWRQRSEALLQEYGGAYVVTYLTLFFGTWFAFWLGVKAGWNTEGVADFGTVGLAWALTKATQPVRIGASALLVPLVVKARRRFWP